MEFVGADGEFIVPKAVRPIIELDRTWLGDRKGAQRQYRQGNLHIREFPTHYTLHSDRFDPRKSPLLHLAVDAPEHVVGVAAGIIIGQKTGKTIYKVRKAQGKNTKRALIEALIGGYLAGSMAWKTVTAAASESLQKYRTRDR